MANEAPYRSPPATPSEQPPSELFCPWEDAEASRGNYFQLTAWTMGGLAVASACVVLMGPWGLAAAGGAALVARGVMKRRPPSGVLLRIEHDVLVLPTARVRLDDLLAVELESKEMQRVTVQQSIGAPALSSVVGPSFEASRIVFVHLDGDAERRTLLTEAFAPRFHGMEWLGKIRVFLRKHEWVPDAERPDADAADAG